MDDLANTFRTLGIHDVGSPTCPTSNPLDLYRSHLAKLLSDLIGVEPSVAQPALQTTLSLDKGDLTLAVPSLRLKGRSPDQVARQIQDELPDSPLFYRPVAERVFVNFFCKPAPLASIITRTVLNAPEDYGRDITLGLRDPADPSKGRKRIVVDFGSHNIAKPFHAGHLRSTIIGGFIANLYEHANWDVVRLNYLGDWGKQYGVLGVAFTDFGDPEELSRDPISHLFNIYVKASAVSREQQAVIKEKRAQLSEPGAQVDVLEAEIQKLQDECVDERARRYFKRMCDGEEESLNLWRSFRELSIECYRETFARLNIHYDVYDGESQIKNESMEEAARILQEKGLSEDSQGAKIIDLTKHSKKLGKAIVLKKDGTSIYLTRDISAVFERYEKYRYDKMIYVIANQQDLHMAQLIKIIELMGREDLSKRLQHINFGLVHGMSTRRGTVRFLDDILRDVGQKMHDVMRINDEKYAQVKDREKTADILGISSVLIQDMGSKRIHGYTFDMDRMTSFEGDTGPYLQYSNARLHSIIRKADIPVAEMLTADMSLLTEKHAADIIRRLAQWPDVVRQTYKNEEPVTVATYLFKLTHVLNSSYTHLNVLKSERDVKLARLALYCSVRHVLSNGMKMLCLTPVERM
ncbi:arginyl-tRNA synthetase [Xylariaceae sp. AK1471]|nr:arginyl-tRNA synthetase [Xylariaceae sp. AK1471]